MEAKLNAIVSTIVHNEPKASGVIIVDSAGLCLTSWGNAPESVSGLILNIAYRSENLLPDTVPPDIVPSTIIETNKMKIVVKRHSNWCVGIIIDLSAPPSHGYGHGHGHGSAATISQ